MMLGTSTKSWTLCSHIFRTWSFTPLLWRSYGSIWRCILGKNNLNQAYVLSRYTQKQEMEQDFGQVVCW